MSYSPVPSLRSSVDAEGSQELDAVLSEKLLLRKPTPWRTGRLTFWASQSLLLVAIALLTANLVLWAKAIPLCQGLSGKSDLIYAKYGNDLRYQTLDHRYDFLWEPNLGAHTGVVLLTSKGAEQSVGGVGMFHQLHCLASIRRTLQAAQEGKDIGRDWRDDDHWPHCMDYLRQAILCSADGTIERPEVINGSDTGTITGILDVRECRNSERLFDLIEERGVVSLGLANE